MYLATIWTQSHVDYTTIYCGRQECDLMIVIQDYRQVNDFCIQ